MKEISCVLSLVVFLGLGVEGIAQTAQPSEPVPFESAAPGRPTLKRRIAKPEVQPTPQSVRTIANPIDSPSAAPEGVALRKPTTVRFEGLITIPEENLRRRLRDLERNQDFATNNVSFAKAEALIKSWLAEQGHRHAEVWSRLEQAGSESPVVTFVIREGPQFTISEISFEGNRVFLEEMLATKMRECLRNHDKENRNVYRPEVVEYCTRILTNFERAQGYLRAKLAEPKIVEIGESVIITIPSDEGILYRLGHVAIDGAHQTSEFEILAMIGMHKGEIARGEKISKALYEDLKAIYSEKGFIQYTAEIQPTFHAPPGASEGIVDFQITIDEGRRFRVWKVSFQGNALPENELRQLIGLREGDLYNQKLFEQGVTQINETGWFDWVDKDKDVDYRTDEEEGLVSLVIKLKKRQ